MSNLAQLIEAAASARPDAVFGTFQQHDRFDRVLARADQVSEALRSCRLGRGDVVAIVGVNCAAYLVTWMAAQRLGLQPALINPAYPDELLAEMLNDLRPVAIIWIARAPGALAERQLVQIDAGGAWDGNTATLQGAPARSVLDGSGRDCASEDIAAYVHTSGTTGRPKFCALSHGYFFGLGRFFADTMCLSNRDIIVNPLPLFHINPIGNGVVGALTANSGFLSMEKFLPTEFWPMVKAHQATVLILHGPPAGMLKAKTTLEDARGHCVRIGFFCDPAFLRQFDVPIGVGGYGSTEAGGYCHSWKFRPDDDDFPPEGATHLSGQPRHDIECRLSGEDEILVRGKHPQVLFSGYAKAGRIDPHLDEYGWFHTGDRGRFDPDGNLIFVERSSESIRVNAEYVPIDFVEERLRQVTSLTDFALWRIDSPSRGHEAVVYTTAPDVDLDELRRAVADLPRYMHPTKIICVGAIPRDVGVGKIQRRLLAAQPALNIRPL